MVSSICALAATVALTFDLVQKVVTILDKHRHEMSHTCYSILGRLATTSCPTF